MAKHVYESDSWSKEKIASIYAPYNKEKYPGELDEKIAAMCAANPVTATCGTKIHKLKCTSNGRTHDFYVCSCIGRGAAVGVRPTIGHPMECQVDMYLRWGMGKMAFTQEELDREQAEYNAMKTAEDVNKPTTL